MSVKDFNGMGLKPDLLTMINAKGFSNPTPIQLKTIPLAMAGHDIMGQAQTGTGKTASFGIPILNNLYKGAGIQALILCPTRELAVQVCEELSFLGKRMGIKVLAVYGGQSIERQVKALEAMPEIVVATPGRLLDHMRRKTISLAKLSFVVIDEADEMLDMGFFPDIEQVLKSCPEKRQTMLFSATLADEVKSLGTKFMKSPQIVVIKSNEKTVPEIEQSYYLVHPAFKMESLAQIMHSLNPDVSLVFCRTKKGVDELAGKMRALGYHTDALHGDMSQRERDIVMYRFRNRKTKVLIATDLAARGLDISHVTHVFNFDVPEDSESYVHRIGRTGRAGKKGIAITLVEPNQIKQLKSIERFIGKSIPQKSLASIQDKANLFKSMLSRKLSSVSDKKSSLYNDLAKELMDNYDTTKLVSGLIAMLLGDLPDPEQDRIQEAGNKNNVRQVRPTKRARIPREISTSKDLDIVNIEVPVGRRSVKNKRQLIDYITTNTSVEETHIGDIEIENNLTFIEVPMNKVDEVYNAFTNFIPQGKKASNEICKRSRVSVSK